MKLKMIKTTLVQYIYNQPPKILTKSTFLEITHNNGIILKFQKKRN